MALAPEQEGPGDSTGAGSVAPEELPAELRRLLYPERTVGPLTITLVYPEPSAALRFRIEALVAAATEHVVDPPAAEGRPPRHRTSFTLGQVEELHQLYHLIEAEVGADRLHVLINGRRLPLVRELWLPLIWTLRP